MNEINYGEVFGVDTGANESAPAQQTDENPGIGTQPDESGTAIVDDAQTKASENTADAADQPGEVKKQSAEENAKYAAARRKAEQERDAAVAKALRAQQAHEDQEWKKFFQKANLKNTITGAPITNREEFRAWEEAYNAARLERDLKEGKLTPSTLNEAIGRNETVREMRSVIARERAAEEAARQQHQKMVLEEQIQLIAKLDSSIKGVEDLMNRPEYPQIYNYVKKGISIEEAFKLANYDKLTSSAGNAARQAALNAANSKEHLAPTSQRGAGSVPVPADVKAQYKLLNPDATDAEIQEHYNRFHKK